MRLLLLIGVSILVVGCTNDRMGSYLASWNGSHFNDVATAWGPPDECSADDAQRVCEWHIQSATVTSVPETRVRDACTTMLAFDSKGYVTGWRWRGEQCRQSATIAAENGGRGRPDALALVKSSDSVPGVAATETTENSR